MFNVIPGRLGHTVDAFAVIEAQHVALTYGPAENQKNPGIAASEALKKHPEDDAVIYQEKLRMRSRVARFFDTQPKCRQSSITHEQALYTEEARQVIHGAWRAHHSEKFWNLLNREEEVDFSFEDVNPAGIDHYVSGICKVQPDFMSTHLKQLLLHKFANNADKTAYATIKDMSYNSRRLYANVHNMILFGGAIPTDKQMESCRGRVSVAGILDSIDDLRVTNDVYVLSIRDVMSPWKVLNTMGAPKPRAFHASTIIYLDSATPVLCLTGGFGPKRQLMDMTLHMLCLIQRKKEPSWVSMHTAGKMPAKRYGHTMGQVGPWLTLFGGTDGQQLFDDLWVLNICEGTATYKLMKSTNVWTRVDIVGLVPAPRCFHATVKIGMDASNPIVIYGGITEDCSSRAYTLRLDKYGDFKWSMLPITIKGPNEFRAFHTMIYSDSQIIITGGEDFRMSTPTIQKSLVYSIPTREFQYADEDVPLTGHRSVMINGVVHHFGGLRSILSSVFLEPIGSPKGMKDALEVRTALEQYYVRELAKELDAHPKGRSAGATGKRNTEDERESQSEKSSARSQSQGRTCATQSMVAGEQPTRSTGRPRRSAAEKCVQHIASEVAKIVAKGKDKSDVNKNAETNTVTS